MIFGPQAITAELLGTYLLKSLQGIYEKISSVFIDVLRTLWAFIYPTNIGRPSPPMIRRKSIQDEIKKINIICRRINESLAKQSKPSQERIPYFALAENENPLANAYFGYDMDYLLSAINELVRLGPEIVSICFEMQNQNS